MEFLSGGGRSADSRKLGYESPVCNRPLQVSRVNNACEYRKDGSYRNGRKLLFAPKIAPKMHFSSVILYIL